MDRQWLFVVLAVIASSFDSASGQDRGWCDGLSAPPTSDDQICIEPSAGPATGGTTITVRGLGTAFADLSHPTFSTWGQGCARAVSWQCNFGCERTALTGCRVKVSPGWADCDAERVYCVTPTFNVESNFFL
eukprot:1508572-Rhodomonas_salina.1